MTFRFTAVAIAILLIGGGIAISVVMGDEPAAPISRSDDSVDIESDLDAALRQDDAADDEGVVEDDTDDDDDTKDKSKDTGDTKGGGGSGSGSGDG